MAKARKYDIKRRYDSGKRGDNDSKDSKFFRLWPKDFHRPYGEGLNESGLSNETFTSRLTGANCYWCHNPGVGMSTMIDTITQCADLLEDMGTEVQQWRTQMEKVRNFAKECKVLNTKSEATGDWDKALKTVLEFVTDSDNVGAFKYFAIMGANLWLPHIHLTTLNFILTNLETVKRKVSEFATPQLKEWSIKNSKNAWKYLKSTVPQPEGQSNTSKDTLSFLQRLTPQKRTAKGKVAPKRDNVSSSSSEESSSDSESDSDEDEEAQPGSSKKVPKTEGRTKDASEKATARESKVKKPRKIVEESTDSEVEVEVKVNTVEKVKKRKGSKVPIVEETPPKKAKNSQEQGEVTIVERNTKNGKSAEPAGSKASEPVKLGGDTQGAAIAEVKPKKRKKANKTVPTVE